MSDTTTPEERKKRVEQIRSDMMQARLMIDGIEYGEDSTTAFLLDELDRREQEHQKAVREAEINAGLRGVAIANETYAADVKASTDFVVSIIEDRHVEEIRKARSEGFYQGQDAGIGEENPWDPCRHDCAHCCERECNEKCPLFAPPSTDQHNA
jgi:hypothetical protein